MKKLMLVLFVFCLYVSQAQAQSPYKTATVIPQGIPYGHVLANEYIRTTVKFRSYSPDVKTDTHSVTHNIVTTTDFYGDVGLTSWRATITGPRAGNRQEVQVSDGRVFEVWFSGEVSKSSAASGAIVTIRPTVSYRLLPL